MTRFLTRFQPDKCTFNETAFNGEKEKGPRAPHHNPLVHHTAPLSRAGSRGVSFMEK